MAYYCGECVVWLGSSDTNKYGERWCSYSRRYEKSDQNVYGCKGFQYVGRMILTKVCDTLALDKSSWFLVFDQVKEMYIANTALPKLFSYCQIAPVLIEKFDLEPDITFLATLLYTSYLLPAKESVMTNNFQEAAQIYSDMVWYLRKRYHI